MLFSILSIWTLITAQEAYAKGCHGVISYKPWRTLLAMGHRDRNLKTVTAYRGIFGPLCPESSFCAAANTVFYGIEAMQIDAGVDADGVLWPIGDERIGRVTNYMGQASRYFDMRHSQWDGYNNPLLETVRSNVIRGLLMRDNDGRLTQYKTVTLEDLLVHIRNTHPTLALIVRVRTLRGARILSQMIHRLKMTARVGVKFFVESVDPKTAADLFTGISNIPVVTGRSLDTLALTATYTHLDGKTVKEEVLSYLEEYTYLEFYMYMEGPAKEWNASPDAGTSATGPFGFVDNFFLTKKFNDHTALGKRHINKNQPDGYYDSQGRCCHPLPWFLERSAWAGDERVDERENLSKFVDAVDHITSDTPVTAVDYLEKAGHRVNVCQLIS